MSKLGKILFIMLGVVMAVFSACNLGESAISVSFSDITTSGKTDMTFAVKYSEEKDYENYGTDILIKSDTDDCTFEIAKEMEEFVTITLKEKGVYYSLTKLMAESLGQKADYKLYKDAVNKNYIIHASENCTLKLKAVVGELSEYKSMLLSSFDVSKEFEFKVKKYEK